MEKYSTYHTSKIKRRIQGDNCYLEFVGGSKHVSDSQQKNIEGRRQKKKKPRKKNNNKNNHKVNFCARRSYDQKSRGVKGKKSHG